MQTDHQPEVGSDGIRFVGAPFGACRLRADDGDAEVIKLLSQLDADRGVPFVLPLQSVPRLRRILSKRVR